MKKDRKAELLEKIRAMRPGANSESPLESDLAPMAEPAEPQTRGEEDVNRVLQRLDRLTGQIPEEEIAMGDETVAIPPQPSAANETSVARLAAGTPGQANKTERKLFQPEEPQTLDETGLNAAQIEELIMKYLLARGEDSGQGVSEQLKLPFNVSTEVLRRLKKDELIHYRDTAALNDYVCSLTDNGRERARRYTMRCTYYGAAPVPIEAYNHAVGEQSLTLQRPKEEDLKRAFSDLLINPNMLLRLGSALNSGRGMFLYGFPGNGKTSIAERVTKAFGETIWIPRAIGVDGEIIRMFDPSQHEEMPLDAPDDIFDMEKCDARWVRIRRPTIIVGGELTMANLELSINAATGINEAPVQLKSNCGTLVIDDFGRQRMTTDELLNRWIVPLEKRYDFLNLPSGKKIEVPFDQLVVFSTNLEPRDLVDDAFLRRIPYKIEVQDPTESEYRQLFRIMCPKMDFEYNDRAIDYLLKKHYAPNNRPMRCCHPRDLLLQVKNLCQYQGDKVELTPDAIDFACENYFSIM
jgi:hypothetical protein